MKKFSTSTGKRSPQVKAKVVSMRKKGASWAAIGQELEIAPRTVRRIFDEKMGAGAHFESRLAGKGGRTRSVTVQDTITGLPVEVKTTKATKATKES